MQPTFKINGNDYLILRIKCKIMTKKKLIIKRNNNNLFVSFLRDCLIFYFFKKMKRSIRKYLFDRVYQMYCFEYLACLEYLFLLNEKFTLLAREKTIRNE
jgi:hypothetical protein